ncbi:MAG TPA: TonB-dependent receptor [Pyrinomonadaceae bacterium]|nr:TonB-dependent receptor [Pyrinomonadaceae bacterium]
MKKLLLVLPALTILSLMAPLTHAQDGSRIRGTVSDETGANIAGAGVTLRSRLGVQQSTITNQTGGYQFANVRPGIYLLEVRAAGFAVFTSRNTQIHTADDVVIDVQLKIGALSESVVITATGTVQRAEEVAKVVSTLTAEELDTRDELTLTEGLRGVPGIRIQQQGSLGSLTSIRVRGQRTMDTSILLDGLRLRDAGDINGSAASLMTDLIPVALSQLEIVRGSGSSLYGTHAIGGVINAIPDDGGTGLHFTAGFEGGSLGTFRERLSVSGGRERIGFNVGVHRIDVRSGVDGEDEYGNSAFGGRFHLNPTPSTTLSAGFYGTISNARLNDSPFPLPEAFTASQQFPKAVAGVTFHPDFNNPDQGRRNRTLLGSVKWLHLIGDHWSYSIAYQRAATNRRNYNGPRIDPRFAAFYPVGEFELLNINRGTIDTIDARSNFRASSSNTLTFGFEFENESLFQRSDPSFNFFNNTTDRQRTFAFFGQDQLSFLDDRLQIAVGVRAQSYRLRAADRPTILQGRDEEGSVTGDGAISYYIAPTSTKLRAHVGNGFRAPSLFERFGEGFLAGAGNVRFGDPTLRAEQSISVDGGIDQRLAGDRVLIGLTYFYTRLQRAVAFTGFANDPLGLGRFTGFTNRPGGLSRGFEGTLQSAPWRGAELRASYTFTNSDRALTSGLAPEYVIPEHLFSLFWGQRIRTLQLSFELNRTGEYLAPLFESNFPFRSVDLRFEGYTKADVFANYDVRRSDRVTVTLFGGVENLFDQDYFENGFRAPGAMGRVGLNVKF